MLNHLSWMLKRTSVTEGRKWVWNNRGGWSEGAGQKRCWTNDGSCKFKIYYPLVTAICLSVKLKILLVNPIYKISKVKYLFLLKIYMCMCVCLSVCKIQRLFVICRIWQLRLTHWAETSDKKFVKFYMN